MPNISPKDVTMTFESNGIPPIVQHLVNTYYLPHGQVLMFRKGIWREYVYNTSIAKLNAEGVDLYKNDVEIKAARMRFTEKGVQLAHVCEDIRAKSEVDEHDVHTLVATAGAYVREYEYFDAWYTDGAYLHRSTAAVAAALDYAEKEKNVMRAEFGRLLFESDKHFLATLTHIGTLLGIRPQDVAWYFANELAAAARGNVLPVESVVARKRAYVYAIDESGVSTVLAGDEADLYIDAFEQEMNKETNEVTGTIAYKGSGTVIGMVRIINSDYIDFATTQAKMDLMNEGDILISPTTAPDLMPALRKAAAIVTDVGGMLSHAALVARELRKPCIVGTAIASRVFKDGDMVEVDADKGIVRRI